MLGDLLDHLGTYLPSSCFPPSHGRWIGHQVLWVFINAKHNKKLSACLSGFFYLPVGDHRVELANDSPYIGSVSQRVAFAYQNNVSGLCFLVKM